MGSGPSWGSFFTLTTMSCSPGTERVLLVRGWSFSWSDEHTADRWRRGGEDVHMRGQGRREAGRG